MKCHAPAALIPSLDHAAAAASLAALLNSAPDPARFSTAIQRLRRMTTASLAYCPPPWPAPGLIVTPEGRCQSERWLPLDDIRPVFERLYRSSLTYPPLLSSTPFHNALSWSDVVAAMPPRFQAGAGPARFLESLLADRDLLTAFLFDSFLPRRFYGGFGRYPGQMAFVRGWLASWRGESLRCLDAACGTGEDTYGLASLLMEVGLKKGDSRVEGWTIEPLEVWAAAFCRFPHDRRRETGFRRVTAPLFEHGYTTGIRFRCRNLLAPPASPSGEAGRFQVILCNGLLGGPIINDLREVRRVVANLAALLAPGGILLTADSFHGGWKQKCPQSMLRALFLEFGLETFAAGEGAGALKPDE